MVVFLPRVSLLDPSESIHKQSETVVDTGSVHVRKKCEGGIKIWHAYTLRTQPHTLVFKTTIYMTSIGLLHTGKCSFHLLIVRYFVSPNVRWPMLGAATVSAVPKEMLQYILFETLYPPISFNPHNEVDSMECANGSQPAKNGPPSRMQTMAPYRITCAAHSWPIPLHYW